jgi:hypothetical protein
MGIVIAVVGWLLALVLAGVTVSCMVRIASVRWKILPSATRAVPDYGLMLPELSGSLLLAVLTFLGVLSPLIGGLFAAAVFAFAAVPLASALIRAARKGEALREARAIAGVLRYLARTGRHFLAEDLRLRAGSRAGEVERPAGTAAGPPKWATVTRPRDVPHLLEDPYLGAHPYPADVAAGLELDQVPVPPHWDRLCQVIGDYEAEDDDDLTDHMTGEAAGVLTAAAAIENRTENLAAARGLDPAIVAAHFDIAEGFAELATRYALLVRRDHIVHGELRQWRDSGGVLPHGAREWFDAGGPDGGGAG